MEMNFLYIGNRVKRLSRGFIYIYYVFAQRVYTAYIWKTKKLTHTVNNTCYFDQECMGIGIYKFYLKY